MTIQEYFKDKIDWKFFNYLLDILTPLEDDYVEYELTIQILDDKGLYDGIYYYIFSEFGDDFDFVESYKEHDDLPKIIDLYKRKGLHYILDISSTTKKKYPLLVDKLNKISNMEMVKHNGTEFIFKEK